MRLPNALECLNECLDADQPAILWGAPGIGKSQAVAALAKRRGARFLDLRVSDADAIDFRGIPAREGNQTIWLRPDFLPNDKEGETILFFDELDRPSAPNVLNMALQIILDRRVGGHVLPDNVRILAAGNGSTDKGTARFSAALNNRFAHFHVEYDAEATRAHFAAIGMIPQIIGFLYLRPEFGWRAAENGENASASPRQWERMAAFFNSPRRFAHATALLGKNVALDFEAFCALYGKIPPIAEIYANPHGAPVPATGKLDDISLFYALSSAIGMTANRGTIGAGYAYLKRLPRDYEVAGMLTAIARDSSLKTTAAYGEFCARNQDVTL